MKMKRRMLSVCLSALMLGAAVPYLPMANTAVFADSGDVVRSGQFRYEIGTNWVATPQNTVEAVKYVRIVGCNKDVTDLVIPAELDGMPVLEIDRDAFEGNTSITSVTIPESIEYLGDGAFADCTALTSVKLPDNLQFIYSGVFMGCSSLTSIHIPDSVKEIGSGAFEETALESVTIPDGVTVIADGAFGGCNSLTSVTIPGSVETIGDGVFYDCTALESITIPEGVKSLGYSVFELCTALKSVSLPNTLETIGLDAFNRCLSLTSITIPKGVKTIASDAFELCRKLEEINVDAENPYFASMDGVLFDKQTACLLRYPIGKPGESYIIPGGVTGIGNEAFMGCKRLKTLTVPDTVTDFGWWIVNNALNSVSICCNPGSEAEAYAKMNHIPYAAASEEAKKVCLPFTPAAVTAVPQTDLTGDLNKDGSVNLKDVVLLRRYIAGGWDVTL